MRERIDVHTARGLARHQVAALAIDSGLELVVQQDRTLTTDIGWVFFYETREFLETGNPHDKLMGNAPILVCHSGAVHLLGTEHPVEHYLDEYRRSGDPYGATATELGP